MTSQTRPAQASPPSPDDLCPFSVLLPCCAATWRISVESSGSHVSHEIHVLGKNLRPQDFISSFSLLKLLNFTTPGSTQMNHTPQVKTSAHSFLSQVLKKINHAFSCTWIMLLIGFFWNIWNQPVQCLQVPAPQTDQTSLVILVCLTSRCWCWLLFGRHLAASSSQNPRCTAPRIIRILFHSWNCWTYDTTHVSQVNQKYQDNQVNGRRPNGDNLWPLFLS